MTISVTLKIMSKASPGNEMELKNNIYYLYTITLFGILWVKSLLMLITNYVIQRCNTV